MSVTDLFAWMHLVRVLSWPESSPRETDTTEVETIARGKGKSHRKDKSRLPAVHVHAFFGGVAVMWGLMAGGGMYRLHISKVLPALTCFSRITIHCFKLPNAFVRCMLNSFFWWCCCFNRDVLYLKWLQTNFLMPPASVMEKLILQHEVTDWVQLGKSEDFHSFHTVLPSSLRSSNRSRLMRTFFLDDSNFHMLFATKCTYSGISKCDTTLPQSETFALLCMSAQRFGICSHDQR